jgi:arabinose-5-phosphate isomerase
MDKSTILAEAKRVFDEEIQAMEKVKTFLDDNFANAVSLVANAHKIVVTGVGKSGNIGNKISATLSSIGVSSVFLHPVDAKIIAIVGNMESYLARAADIALNATVEKEACPFNLAPTTSTTVALALGDALAVAVMKVRGVTQEDFSRLHPSGQIGRNITLQVKDVMHSKEKAPKISPDADMRSLILEMSNKSLGCVCVCDNNDFLIGLVTDGDIRRIFQNVKDLDSVSIEDIMTKSPVKVKEHSYLAEALSLMENRKSQISVLPVVSDEGKCVGVIRIHDIISSGV